MKVLNLQCDVQHAFEGWFSDDADYQQQIDNNILRCPVCDSEKILKLPSAPRLNLSGVKSTEAHAQPANANDSMTEMMSLPKSQLQAMLLEATRQLMAGTKDVGERFADEARRMHYGEKPHEAIRGRASKEEADALHDEGIDFIALAIPASLKEPLQ